MVYRQLDLFNYKTEIKEAQNDRAKQAAEAVSGAKQTDGALSGAGHTDGGRESVTPSERAGAGGGGEGPILSDANRSNGSVPAHFYDVAFLSDVDIGTGGKKTKFKNNVAAIRLLHKLEAGSAEVTESERRELALFVSWGGLPEAFIRPDGSTLPAWANEAQELKALLSDEEYRAAETSTTDAHYTSKAVVSAMWRGVKRMGFRGGKVLEPAAGIGNFIGLMPPDKLKDSFVNAVEMDTISARIMKQIYPMVNVHEQGFQESNRFDPEGNSYDLVIGNPPFGHNRVHDPRHPFAANHSIHSYFILKSIASVRPNGVVAMVISQYFMEANDKAGRSARRAIAEQAEFLGAIRLPNNTFQKNAGTSVTSDIVFFRKYPPETSYKVRLDPNRLRWLKVAPVDKDYDEDMADDVINLNTYFQDNPLQMLGQWGRFGGTAYGNECALKPFENTDEIDFEHRLNDSIENINYHSMPEPEPPILSSKEWHGLGGINLGAFFLYNKRIYKRERDIEGAPQATEVALNMLDTARVKDYLILRTSLQKLLEGESMETSDLSLGDLRARLNMDYRQFRLHGLPLTNRKMENLFKDDPEYSKVAGLELKVFDKRTKKTFIEKAPIFSRRASSPASIPNTADSPHDALSISLSHKGCLDLDFMSGLCGKTPDEIRAELGDLIYQNAEGNYETVDRYLSGDVVTKLEDANRIAKNNPEFVRNVAALEEVVPERVLFGDINAPIGSHWLPEQIMRDYVREAFQDSEAKVSYSKQIGKWGFLFSDDLSLNDDVAVVWGTGRVTPEKILRHAVNQTVPRVFDRGADGSRVPNREETELALEKVSSLQQNFKSWCVMHDEYSSLIADEYNRLFVREIPRKFDGSHLRLPGQNPEINLHDHQLNAIWRAISSGRPTLFNHTVGAGKTYTICAAAMEMRRLGQANKIMIVVPNNLMKQWELEFLKLYPGAQILAPRNLKSGIVARQELCAKIAYSDQYDAILIPHSVFDRIGVSAQRESEFLVDTIEELLVAERTADQPAYTVKQMVAQRKALQAKLTGLRERIITDKGITFEELGVDMLFVDESQHYKNLVFNSSAGRVKGIPANGQGSGKATQLYLISQMLAERNGNIIFGSGTPVSNSPIEVYNLGKMLNRESMVKDGTIHPDAFLRMHADITHDHELNILQQFVPTSRISGYNNLEELMRNNFNQYADTVTRPEIEQRLKENGQRSSIPPHDIVPIICPASPAQKTIFLDLAKRMENLDGTDNALVVLGDARKVSLDIRVYDPKILQDYPESKLNMAALKIQEVYASSVDVKGTQLVFLDMSVPKSKEMAEQSREISKLLIELESDDGTVSLNAEQKLKTYPDDEIEFAKTDMNNAYSAYDDLRQKLIGMNVNEDEIAFIHDAGNSPEQKEVLFSRVRSGDIRILLGSTSRLGAGVNVQERLVAIHHIDCPYRPSDITQRNGRLLRPGNGLYEADPDNFGVKIYQYVTKGSCDAFLWQIQENKLKFINQLTSGVNVGRNMLETDSAQNIAQQMKAHATDNPLFFDLTKLVSEQHEIDSKEHNWNIQRSRLTDLKRSTLRKINYLKTDVERMERGIEVFKKSVPTGKNFALTINGKPFTKHAEAGGALIKLHRDMMVMDTEKVKELECEPIGQYGDFKVYLETEQYTSIRPGHRVYLSSPAADEFRAQNYIEDETTALGAIRGLTGAVGGLGVTLEGSKELLKHNENQLARIPQRLLEMGDSNPHTIPKKEVDKKITKLNYVIANSLRKQKQAEREKETARQEAKTIQQEARTQTDECLSL